MDAWYCFSHLVVRIFMLLPTLWYSCYCQHHLPGQDEGLNCSLMARVCRQFVESLAWDKVQSHNTSDAERYLQQSGLSSSKKKLFLLQYIILVHWMPTFHVQFLFTCNSMHCVLFTCLTADNCVDSHVRLCGIVHVFCNEQGFCSLKSGRCRTCFCNSL